jgi:hypothetical protein
MKSSLVQTILGLAIIVLLWVYDKYIFWGYWALYHIDPVTNLASPFIIHWPAFSSPDSFLATYFALGPAIFGCAIAQTILYRRWNKPGETNRAVRYLALAEVALGTSFVALMFWYLFHVEPYLNLLPLEVTATNGGASVIFHDPGWERLLIFWKAGSFVTGLAVITLGVLQFKAFEDRHSSFSSRHPRRSA